MASRLLIVHIQCFIFLLNITGSPIISLLIPHHIPIGRINILLVFSLYPVYPYWYPYWVDELIVNIHFYPCFSWFSWDYVTPKRSFKGAPGGTAPGSRLCWKSTARVFAASWSSSSCWSDDTISYRRIGGLRIARGVGSWCCLKIWIGYWWILTDI